MNSLKAPLKIVSKETGITLYIVIASTIALFGLYVCQTTIAYSTELLGILFGPFYAIFLAYSFIFFKSYKFILALGGTRKQFIVSSFLSTLAFIIICTIILNVLYLISGMTFQNGFIFH